jgi:hypothetical protein
MSQKQEQGTVLGWEIKYHLSLLGDINVINAVSFLAYQFDL